MRLFAAVLPPPPAVAELAAAVAAVHGLPGSGQLRWSGREQWHFTVAFFGEVPEEVLPDLGARLARAAGRHPAHRVRLAGAGRFGRTVLWAGAEGDLVTLRALASSARAAGRRAGVPAAEQHPYAPHLTLARSRSGRVDLRPFVDGLAGLRGSWWTAGELVLLRSHLPASGVPGEQPRYERVKGWPLAA
ncbi:RNA 2',3'-cyclic phosphodiesterase [Streptomyces sp. NPDC059740]|uniref:RNA 2',3'-cyclic phosphodiesterase n=1 Tax=Streptomyces sp. NPDC059740 TaxID=3346926 RepID=UPI0036640D55